MRGTGLLAGLLALTGSGFCLAAAWIEAKPALARALIERAWERHERGAADARPWPWADTVPIARLAAPGGAAQDFVVLEGASGRNLAFAPAHDAASVLPGERGNSVIAGHRDTSFRFLERLHAGDRLRIERGGHVYWFSVNAVQVVDSRRTRIALGGEEARLTLVTCYPFGSLDYGGPLRFVVSAVALAPPSAARTR